MRLHIWVLRWVLRSKSRRAEQLGIFPTPMVRRLAPPLFQVPELIYKGGKGSLESFWVMKPIGRKVRKFFQAPRPVYSERGPNFPKSQDLHIGRELHSTTRTSPSSKPRSSKFQSLNRGDPTYFFIFLHGIAHVVGVIFRKISQSGAPNLLRIRQL